MRDEFEASGAWLFRWRSFVPLGLLALFLAVVHEVPRPYTALDSDEPWEVACILLALLGFAIRVATVGCTPRRTSGRNTRHQVAATLNTTGMYSIVRHPLYLGNLIITLGIASFPQLWWLTALALCAFVLYYERIMFAEEAFLADRFGSDYAAWSSRTPSLFPRFRHWVSPSLSFSLRNVMKREYNGAYAIVVVFTLLDLDEALSFASVLQPDVLWTRVLPVATFLWCVLRVLKRHSSLLDVEGR